MCLAEKEFDEDYHKWIKNRDIEKSEQAWLKLKEKHKHSFQDPLTDKQKNELKSWRWLENIYDQRKHWVRAYLQNTFFAGMKSRQMSESINTFFDGFVHNSTPMSEFIDQYDNAIADRRDKDKDQDFICMTTKPDLTKLTPIESHASHVYKKNVFNKFKEKMFPETLNGTEDAGVSMDESAEGLNFILPGKMDNMLK
ncbi:hypothetical protein POM88_029304 [Heracleum sosnowskyi]|uniref:Protein FAR1-RELATED SEQUENCE n=1 Tax=Heracleum sosnowskyi TaxID=360622 RepID=A0AAD8MH45_9APIA|nr:hypothetical protein POM88_029304 [Heracleum sosnowskyi]